MLQKNGCREAFWVGNLKHKNSSGVEARVPLPPLPALRHSQRLGVL